MKNVAPEQALEAMLAGDVLLLETDTLPGLHVLATPEGASKLIRLKRSKPDRPFLLLVGSVEAAFELGHCANDDDARDLAEAWPGPITALLVPNDDTPASWCDEGESVAVRVPEPGPLREFLIALNQPVFSTSANQAGEEPATDIEQARASFPSVDVIQWETSPCGTASTIVDFTCDPPFVVREGAVPWPPDTDEDGFA